MAQDNEKEIQQLKNRFHELADRVYSQGVFTFTGFLGLAEQDVFWREERSFRHVGYTLYGGREGADRVVARFGNAEEMGYEAPFPVVCVHITPRMPKFADELSHRDFLGALMNLGIDRGLIGDIKVGEKEAYLFCLDSIAEFICDNLEQVKHTHVKCAVTESWRELAEEEPELVNIQVQSMRVDAVLSKVYNLSREKSLELFRAGRVYLNGRLCENNARSLSAGDVVNARGYGKFRLTEGCRETRKGKLAVDVSVYR